SDPLRQSAGPFEPAAHHRKPERYAAADRRKAECHGEARHFRTGGWIGPMNWMPSKLGAEPKNIPIPSVFVATGGFFLISSQNSPGDSPAPVRPVAAAAPEPLHTLTRPAGKLPTRNLTRNPNSSLSPFKPTVTVKDLDPSNVDPTLHL